MRVAIVLLAFFAFGSHAADRVALLIGNNNYASAQLRNATNDARDLGEVLKELGFKVIVKENVTRRDMIEGIREFGAALEGANTALFFYAGHAMQFKDRNYLIPIDAAMGSEEDVTFFSVEINQVFDRMDRAKTRFNFLILDACRDNPFASSFKVTSAGLAQMSAPSGTLIAYATSPGSVAADGFGRNGVYTKYLLQNIRTPDQPVEIMFKRVREAVEQETRKLQTPWDSSSLKGDFLFNASTARPATPGQSVSGPSADTQAQIEREFWVSVRDSTRVEDVRAYLDKYPNGSFAPLAKNRIEALLRPTRVASTAEAPPASQNPVTRGDAKPEPQSVSTPPAKPEEKATVVASAPTTSRPAATAVPVTSAPAGPAPAAPKPPLQPPAAAAPAAAAAAPPAAPAKRDDLPGREISPGVRELTFADGSIYRGGMRGLSLHGKGEYTSKAFQYQGEFKEGLKDGPGVYVWENGDRYEGDFANDRPSGKGKYLFASGDTYEGDVKAGIIVGRGTSVTKDGDTFDGSFVDGKPHGTGVYRFKSGDRYEGEMAQGKMNGKGRYIAKGGDVIQGSFQNGKPEGQGIYTFSNGDRYEGDIRGGALTGKGTYFHASGLKYEGEMAEGRPQGLGVFWFADGTRFEGAFENGLVKARGDMVRQDGSRIRAEIVDGNVRLLN
ncbi:hypothetical protein BWI17_02955 [Betaproteobacteria bacterium GR16-43]|nr:hypothetical protein BWI17_02955 [Betaproteobacteria bacterium GR16-43]